MTNTSFSDRYGYKGTLVLAHVGWWGTVMVVALRSMGVLNQQTGSFALLTLGLGVTASLSLSRYRMGQTIVAAYEAGMRTAVTLNANVFTDTCIMALDGKGAIESVDHADAVGWESEELVGREIRTLLAPRSLGVRKIEPGTSITCPMYNQGGATFDARISVASLAPGLSQEGDGEARRLIATVSPLVPQSGMGG